MKQDYYRHLYAGGLTLILAIRKDSAQQDSDRYGADAHTEDDYDLYTLYYDGNIQISEQTEEDKGAFVNKSLVFSVSTLELEQKSVSLVRIPAYVEFNSERFSIRRTDFKPRRFGSSIQTLFTTERDEGQKV
jgi:hypothetical protein